jgi:Fur family ferric uptake transcriptional regulator
MARLSRAEAAALLERFRRHLRDQHLPVTRQRDLVAQTVLTSDEHLSVDAIQRQLKEQGERVGTATVYRTLDVLVRSGLVRAHDFGEGFKRYEPMPQQTHHEHLICLRCGKVVEFQNERLERMIPIIADEYAFQHQRHRVEVYGLCQECRRRDLGSLAEDGV